jgi:hypothetical protein
MLFNGCSYVDNVHLQHESPDWYDLNWPALVANKLGYAYNNIAISGASNSRIFRTSVDAIVSKECDAIVIGWTNKEREELPYYTGEYARLQPTTTGLQYTQNAPDLHTNWYKLHHNEWLSLYQLVRYIVVLQQLADYNDIKIFMFNAIWHNNLKTYYKELVHNFNTAAGKHQQDVVDFENLYSKINWNNWILDPKTTLAQLAIEQNLKFDNTGHLVLSAQPVVAEFMSEKIK